MKLLHAVLGPLLLGTLVASQGGAAGGVGMEEGIQDSVYAFGTSSCKSKPSDQDEDIMIDCFDPKTSEYPMTTHQAIEYSDEVPPSFKSFHGSEAGLNACVYSFNSSAEKVNLDDFKHALAAVKITSHGCTDVPSTHGHLFLNKASNKMKKIAKTMGGRLTHSKTHSQVVQVHRYACLLEETCRVSNV